MQSKKVLKINIKQKFRFLSINICKFNHEMLQSNPYPDLSNVIQFRAAAASAREGRQKDHNSRQKLDNLNMMQINRAKCIKDKDQLLALAEDSYD